MKNSDIGNKIKQRIYTTKSELLVQGELWKLISVALEYTTKTIKEGWQSVCVTTLKRNYFKSRIPVAGHPGMSQHILQKG